MTTKTQVKVIEAKARRIMTWENKYGAEKTAKKFKKKSLPYLYYHIFEDANYHSLNSVLEQNGVFKGTYGNARKDYDAYRKAGGRTWNIWD